jgi:excisionase family DNA binding protein
MHPAMSQLHTPSPIFTRHESAAYSRVCLRTLDSAIANGNIQVIRIGRSLRIRKSALDAFLEACETRVNPKRRPARR